MSIATVTFRKCLFKSKEYDTDHSYVGARISFDLEEDGRPYPHLYADIRHRVGQGAGPGPLEVEKLFGYDGPLNGPVFQGLVEFYYKEVVGMQGLLAGPIGLRLLVQGQELERDMRVQFEVPEQ
ncbi:MAG: hypothetical protein ACREI3_05955 [Nitrospirales bacterium]